MECKQYFPNKIINYLKIADNFSENRILKVCTRNETHSKAKPDIASNID